MVESPELEYTDWTSPSGLVTGGSQMKRVLDEIAALKKWKEAHAGLDAWAAGPDFPHPSQRIRALYFYEGQGRISANGFEVIGDPATAASVPGIRWVTQFSDRGVAVPYPYATLFANLEESPAGEVAGLLSLAVNASVFKQSSIQIGSETDGYAGSLGVTPTVTLRVRDNDSGFLGTAILSYDDPTVTGRFTLGSVPLYLEPVPSDFGNLTDGLLWYRGDTDKFRARANGVTENLATESYVTTAIAASPANNVLPYVAKTTTYTTTNADGLISLDATGGAFTVTLVTAVGNAGLTHTFKRIDASTNHITIDANGAQTIDGVSDVVLVRQWECITIFSNGANWLIKEWY